LGQFLKGSLRGDDKDELISCFHRFNLQLAGYFHHVAGGEGRKRKAEKPWI